jgi:choline dehydrogenase-like flavoprotein
VNLGLCNLGCPSNAKQSTLVAYVPRAERAGARVLADARVTRIRTGAGAVLGVDARTATGEDIAVDAPLVCLAAGVLETPALLQRSGVPHAGAGVAFHSSTHVTARFAEPIHGYYGPTMGFAIHEWSDVNGHAGPGVMIENTSVLPMATAASLTRFGARHAARMAQLPHLARALVVVRDRTRGTIAADGTVAYDLLDEDLGRLRAGMDAAARAYLAAGAEEVWLPVTGLAPVRRERDLAALRQTTLRPRDLTLLYAVHLFGGAAMGRGGTCDEDGSVRGIRGLYVTDAASLPSNTGVNPQITILANALRIASGIVQRSQPT